jgi:hypothetical protein
MTVGVDPVSRQQVADWLTIALAREAGEDVGEIGVGIDAVQLIPTCGESDSI